MDRFTVIAEGFNLAYCSIRMVLLYKDKIEPNI